MNIEEIQELKRGDYVRDRVTGAIFEVCQVDCYPDELEQEDYVSIPLRIKLTYLPVGIKHIKTGSDDSEVFENIGDHDYVYYDRESYHNAEVVYVDERILTCEDLEPTTFEKIIKPENVVSFKDESLIEFSDDVKEAALAESDEIGESLIFPVEEAQANREKFFTLKRELVQISQLIKEASVRGKSCVRIPADLDRLEITTQFSRAGYKIYAGCIAW